MIPSMRSLIAALMLSVAASGQTARVPPDEAVKHLVKPVAPQYPPLAAVSRIQGNVILEITVSESGAVSVDHVVRGHPLLVDAAIDAIRRCKFRPFDVDGKPAAIRTFVAVRFGHPASDAEDAAELVFQHNFSVAADALGNGDLLLAEQMLNQARDLLAVDSSGMYHLAEQGQWFREEGNLRRAQQKYDEAEQNYKAALALYAEDAPALADLAELYYVEKQYGLARENAARSVALYKKLMKIGSPDQSAQQACGRAIARQSWILARIAMEQEDSPAAMQACRTVLKFRGYFEKAERGAPLSMCQQTLASERPSR